MPIRNLLILTVALSLVGCQLFQPEPDPEPEPEREPQPLPEDTLPEHEAERSPLSRAIDHLQDGEAEAAEFLLQGFLEDSPGHGMARKLLDQIQQSPASLLGTESYFEVTVEPGDSLSDLAAEHLNDGLLFYTLARFNDIEQPRLLQPGTVLRIPETDAVPEPDRSLEQTVSKMVSEGRLDQAFTLLLSTARAGGLNPEGGQQLIRVVIGLTDRALDAGSPEQAATVLEQAEPYVEDAEGIGQFERQRNRVAARRVMDEALQADELGQRRDLLLETVALDPAWEAPRNALADMEDELVEHFHDRALKAWRDQEIETAAGLWEQVLEIDPEFEPAKVYLERARDVLRRLEAL